MEEKHSDRHLDEEEKLGAKRGAYSDSEDEEIRNTESDDDVPSIEVISLRDGYNQTYIIRNSTSNLHEVLFRCGNWCYSGVVDLGGEQVTLSDLQLVIPALQKQQGSLQYLCEWRSIPKSSVYSNPISVFYNVTDTIGNELSSEAVENAIYEASKTFSWVDDDDARNFFEFQTTGYDCFEGFDIVASKTFVRGLVLIVIYYQKSIFVMINNGEGDQPLLDVRFPDFSQHLQGLQIRLYNNDEYFKKLLLWQAIKQGPQPIVPRSLKVECKDVSGSGYNQTFLIRKARKDSGNNLREVLFRFGNWCYNGHVDLGPKLQLTDIPVVIPMLRRQQSALTFMCETMKMPATSLFAEAMEYFSQSIPIIQRELSEAESIIVELSEQGLGDNGIQSLLDDDESECFFECELEEVPELKDVEAIASKVYLNGVVLIIMFYGNKFYVVVQDGGDEQPLLDTRFPDIRYQSNGMQIRTYRNGISDCPELRRISLWRTGQHVVSSPKKVQEPKRNEEKKVDDGERTKNANSSSSTQQKSKAGSPTRAKVAHPHHIAPLKGAPDLKSRLKDLGHDCGSAPWDINGKPLGVTFKK